MTYLPKLLLIDMTAMEGSAATSSLKRAFFSDWRENGLLHVRSGGHNQLLMTAPDGNEIRLQPGEQSARKVIDTFKPDVILYRPVADHEILHQYAMQLVASSDAPVIIWMMDDWPARLHADAPEIAMKMDADLKALFAESVLNLAISESMSKVFSDRYGVSFEVAHNGVNPAGWIARDQPPAGERTEPLRLRYAGSLAPDMTLESVFAVADMVGQLAERGQNIRFEGYTQPFWHRKFADRFNALPHVNMAVSDLAEQAYRDWLVSADIVLLAYNFDDATRRYLQYSFANKMPELLASGRPVLAYGPVQLETLGYLRKHKLGLGVEADNPLALEAALCRLISDPELRDTLGRAGREHAFNNFDLQRSKRRLRSKIIELSRPHGGRLGQMFSSDQKMQLDECRLIADVLNAGSRAGVMIDVGAHHGSSLLPFAHRDGPGLTLCDP